MMLLCHFNIPFFIALHLVVDGPKILFVLCIGVSRWRTCFVFNKRSYKWFTPWCNREDNKPLLWNGIRSSQCGKLEVPLFLVKNALKDYSFSFSTFFLLLGKENRVFIAEVKARCATASRCKFRRLWQQYIWYWEDLYAVIPWYSGKIQTIRLQFLIDILDALKIFDRLNFYLIKHERFICIIALLFCLIKHETFICIVSFLRG